MPKRVKRAAPVPPEIVESGPVLVDVSEPPKEVSPTPVLITATDGVGGAPPLTSSPQTTLPIELIKQGKGVIKRGVTLTELQKSAMESGLQSAAGARAILQRACNTYEQKELATLVWQISIGKVKAEKRKRILIRDVELVLHTLEVVRRDIIEMQKGQEVVT